MPETFGLYLQAIIDQAKDEAPKDEALTPHLIEENARTQRQALEQAAAYKALTPEDKLRLGYLMYY